MESGKCLPHTLPAWFFVVLLFMCVCAFLFLSGCIAMICFETHAYSTWSQSFSPPPSYLQSCGLRARVWQRTPCKLLGKSVLSDNDLLKVKTHEEPQAAHALIVVMLACFLLRSSTGFYPFPQDNQGTGGELLHALFHGLGDFGRGRSGLGIQTLRPSGYEGQVMPQRWWGRQVLKHKNRT